MGRTKVLCTAAIEPNVPRWLDGSGRGWLTAEYGMLPASTGQRKHRDRGGRVDGRTVEIQRIVGRTLRSMVDLTCLGERTIWIDCDVIEADGGTRTAAITGGCVAVVDAIEAMRREGIAPKREPLRNLVGAISVGMIHEAVIVDLCYEEDSRADVDLNIAMTGCGDIIEVQGTAEGRPYPRKALDAMLDKGAEAIRQLIEQQRNVLKGATLPQ
jgi:ribonuclease PH